MSLGPSFPCLVPEVPEGVLGLLQGVPEVPEGVPKVPAQNEQVLLAGMRLMQAAAALAGSLISPLLNGEQQCLFAFLVGQV